MKGLLIKDFLNLKSYGRMLLLMLVLYGVIAVVTGSAAYLSSLAMVFCVMVPLTGTALDEQAHWGAYAQCMPVKRRQVIQSKYLLIVITAVCALVLSLLVTLLVAIRTPQDWPATLLTNALIACMMLLISGITQPLMLKFGVEKARFAIMIVFILCMLVLVVAGNLETLPMPSLAQVPIFLVPIALAVFVGSYFLSVAIYEKKEL